MYESMIERVKQTHSKLRQQMLSAVFQEFDGKIMGLFSFYREGAYLFYLDVTREWFPYHTPTEKPTWIQGDLHFENFGAFRSGSGAIELQPVSREEKEALLAAWPNYIASLAATGRAHPDFYRVKDIAVKHGSGTASIGLDRYYILIEGGREAGGLDDLVLEVMGRITAKLHARADADVEQGLLPYHSEKEIEKAMGNSCGDFTRTLGNWAISYSRQVETDYRLFPAR